MGYESNSVKYDMHGGSEPGIRDRAIVQVCGKLAARDPIGKRRKRGKPC